jgi:hypothetical protein
MGAHPKNYVPTQSVVGDEQPTTGGQPFDTNHLDVQAFRNPFDQPKQAFGMTARPIDRQIV